METKSANAFGFSAAKSRDAGSCLNHLTIDFISTDLKAAILDADCLYSKRQSTPRLRRGNI